MLLGKRPRPPMRRTASMTGMTFDRVPQEPSDDGPPNAAGAATPAEHAAASPRDHPDFISATPTNRNSIDDDGSYSYDHRNYVAATAAMASPGRNPHGTAEHMEMAQFLRICWLCRRSLVPGRDIYMYRGDTAFCSLECREQQMKKDERKEKRA